MKLYSLWDTGEENAPDLVRRVFDRWRALNPNHELIVYDGPAMEEFLAPTGVDLRPLRIQAKSNFLRVKLLAEKGGVWVDATLLPVVPLDDWLPQLLEPAGFFTFRRDGFDRKMGTWFLASDGKCRLPALWLEEMKRYHAQPRQIANEKSLLWRLRRRGDYMSTITTGGPRRRYPYFWVFYLFEKLVTTNPEAAAIWKDVPVWPVLPTHALAHARYMLKMEDPEFIAALPYLLRTAPIQKLDWRKSWPDEVFTPMDPASVIH